MADDGHERRSGDYRLARISAAAALSGVVVFLLVYDAFDQAYSASEVVVSLLLGTIMTLLGIDALSWIRGGSK